MIRTSFWALTFFICLTLPIFYPVEYALDVFVIFAIYASINVMWTLVLGTAGIFSFATTAIFGVAAYAASYLSISHGAPWWAMLPVGVAAGAAGGVLIALPARRLQGIYYGLLTFGLVELCRALVLQTPDLGQVIGLYGADSFSSPEQQGTFRGAVTSHYAAVALLGLVLLVYRGITTGRLGLLLRTSKEAQFAHALGVDVARARLAVFVLSSSVLGLVGGFYAANYRGVSPSIFSFDLLLMLFAMVVIGGIGSASGAVAGTAILVVVDQYFATAGAMRYVAIGVLLFAVTVFANRGLVGLAQRFGDRLTAPGESHHVATTGLPVPDERGVQHD